jgi:hypothetical protein
VEVFETGAAVVHDITETRKQLAIMRLKFFIEFE